MKTPESVGRRASRALATTAAAAAVLVLAACVGSPADQSGAVPAGEQVSWLQRQQLQVSAGLGQMRDRVNGALGNAGSNAGDALRRAGSRAIAASDACFSTDETEGCAVAARNACRRASYTNGAPLASSTYVACSGVWGVQAADAPDSACKTKRRLNAAICW